MTKYGVLTKNRALSLFFISEPLTCCKVSEKTNEQILRKLRYGRTNGRTDGSEFIGPCGAAGGPKSEKIQKYDQRRCFWPKKGWFLDSKKGPKVKKSSFYPNFTFYTFYPNLGKKKAKNYKNTAKKGVFGPKNGNFGGEKKIDPKKNVKFFLLFFKTLCHKNRIFLSRSSRDIAISKIERSDWSRAFTQKKAWN